VHPINGLNPLFNDKSGASAPLFVILITNFSEKRKKFCHPAQEAEKPLTIDENRGECYNRCGYLPNIFSYKKWLGNPRGQRPFQTVLLSGLTMPVKLNSCSTAGEEQPRRLRQYSRVNVKK